jgi:hypothetical protein
MVERNEGLVQPPDLAPVPEPEAIVSRYLEAWNENDPRRRLGLLANACTETVRYVDPEVDVTGPGALSRVIESFRNTYPAHELRLSGEVDAHHDVLRFRWSVEGEDGSALGAGLDACILAPDGRLESIAGFFD